jgi:hypothetical protein
MALDLTGIENVEFYSGHYLDAVLEGDLKGLFDKWKKAQADHGTKPPYERFAPVAAAWERARKAASGETDPATRLDAAASFHAELVEALGYTRQPDVEALEDGKLVPLVARADRDGRAYLWIVEAPFAPDEDTPALDTPLLRAQYPASVEAPALQVVPRSQDPAREGEAVTWRELLDSVLFRLEEAPRWILFLAGDELVLAERNKWPAGRFLRFDLGQLLSRRESKALQAFCALVHRDSLSPDDGACLHDTLEEKSHKHAFAVSGDLKHGVRRAIELLGNEAVWFRREVQKKGVFGEPDLAEKLKDDCLTFMYRLLFLLYVEARGSELGIVPMKSDAYREGYSIESLRELELVPLTTEASRNGYYLDRSLKTLFRIVNDGFFADGARPEDLFGTSDEEVMRVPALRAPLFDDTRLKVLGGVRFRNHVLQEIIRLLSLSSEKKKGSRGRISYADLGISQLGAVYESLLSYSGFFANEDEGLYEVASKADIEKLSKGRGGAAASREHVATYFVPGSQIGRYDEAEFVRDEHGNKVSYDKGTFVYALAGRAREKSASYYTPEVLTRCVVKYALKELLYDAEGKRKLSAQEILALTVCEPAMGSGAFLIEAIDQLADAYLATRQNEVGETLPSDRYLVEKRRVKARLATNNCYGVDLNPTAVELAQVSLWLGSMAEGGKCPWFGLRLANGNSLIGARREVFNTEDVIRKGGKDQPNWLSLVPDAVSLHHTEGPGAGSPIDRQWQVPPRPKGTIYHFLLPAEGMAAFDKDKVIKELAPDDVKRIKDWRKKFAQPFTKDDAKRLEALSDAVDRLWSEVVRERHFAATETTDRISVWREPKHESEPADAAPLHEDLLITDQEAIAKALEGTSSAYRRLKLVMDAWCALWFWPIEQSAELPSRDEWLASLELVLVGQARITETVTQRLMFEETRVEHSLPLTAPAASHRTSRIAFENGGAATAVLDEMAVRNRISRLNRLSLEWASRQSAYALECGLADVTRVVQESRWLGVAESVQSQQHFHHWELRFAEALGARGGFDLVVGNPPWIKLQWTEAGILSEFDPQIALGALSASDVAKLRERVLDDRERRRLYIDEFGGMIGAQAFLNASQNYALLSGTQSNLYKCFLVVAPRIGSPTGIGAIIHQKGLYDDPRAAQFRSWLAPRLKLLLHFSNKKKLFDAIKDEKHFEISIYVAAQSREVRFTLVSNLFHPITLDQSFHHDGRGAVPGIKDESGEFDLRGHRSRLVSVDLETLKLFAAIYDAPGIDPLAARLPVVHSTEIVKVLRRFAEQPRKLGDLKGQYFATEMFDEAAAQQDDTIRSETQQPAGVSDLIIQGPHYYVANPFYKTPNENCRHNQDYISIDLTSIAEDYLPRTNFVPACKPSIYLQRIPKWDGRKITEYFRYVNRTMVSPTGERTLIPSILPPGVAHVDLSFSVALKSKADVALLVGIAASLAADFFIKSTGKGHVRNDVLSLLPFPSGDSEILRRIRGKVLELCCLTRHFAELWEDGVGQWAAIDSRMPGADGHLGDAVDRRWNWWSPIRTDFTRRKALVELDVLVCSALGLSLADLLTMYQTQFPVLQQYEKDRRYDYFGRLVPTASVVLGEPAISLIDLGAELSRQTGFDRNAKYGGNSEQLEQIVRLPVQLPTEIARLLDVESRCVMGDLLGPQTVTQQDRDEGTRDCEVVWGVRYIDPGVYPRMARIYPTPWVSADRMEDYLFAWSQLHKPVADNAGFADLGDVVKLEG